jgi:hypothetical protein
MFDGKRLFLSEVDPVYGRKSRVGVVTYHTPHVGMALHLTKYKAEALRLELSHDDREYEVEPLHLPQS